MNGNRSNVGLYKVEESTRRVFIGESDEQKRGSTMVIRRSPRSGHEDFEDSME
jgi:hypothetical protein